MCGLVNGCLEKFAQFPQARGLDQQVQPSTTENVMGTGGPGRQLLPEALFGPQECFAEAAEAPAPSSAA